MFYNYHAELSTKLGGILSVGALWARAEYRDGVETLRVHFTVLDTNKQVELTKILVHDGVLVGQITTLHELEASRNLERYSIVSYWYVPDDQVGNVHFGS